MATISIECPSGLSGEVRGLKVKEADMLASATRRKRHEVVYDVMTACWSSTSDPGPYGDGADPPNWDKILQGDINYALMQIRIATFGSGYAFKVQCADAFCRERFEWELDLSDVPVQMLPESSRAQLADGNEFSCEVDGKKYSFALPTGGTAKKASKIRKNNRENKYSFAIRMRLTGVEGVQPNDMKRFLSDMGMGEMRSLIAEFDEHDCGVDGDLEIECPECGGVQDMPLPFEGEFFFPRHQKSKKVERKQADTSSVETQP